MSAQINLYHERFRIQREWVTLANLLIVAGVLASLMAVAGVWASQRLASRTAEAAAATAQTEALRQQVAAATAALSGRKPSAQLLADVANAEVLLKRREEIAQLLESGSVGSTAGFSDHLRALARQAPPGLWLTGFMIASGGNEMEIRGRMNNPEALPNYIRRLGSEKAFQGLSFSALTLNRPSPVPVPGAAGAVPPASTSAQPVEFRLQPTRISVEGAKP